MNRARWIHSAASLLALWLLGALVFLPRLQRALASAAQDMLSQQPPLQQRLGGLHLDFDGLQAHLTGSVRTPQDRAAVESALRDLVRAPVPLSSGLGRLLNPVSSVDSRLEVVPSPPGWMLLAADGPHAHLLGIAANAFEARDLARSVQDTWNARGGLAEGQPGTDAASHDEAASVSATLRAVPEPQSTAQAYLARIGQPWNELSLQHSDADLLNEARALGITPAEWQSMVLPALHQLRATLQQQQLAQAEQDRLARLPPGHLFIAVRDQQIILRGEVGSAAMKSAVLTEALSTLSPLRIHDEIRVTDQRRPSGDFGPITTALLPEEKKPGARSLFLSLSGGAWKPVDWQITPAEQSWKHELPAGLDPALLLTDSAALTSWLDGTSTTPLHPSLNTEPSFIALILFGSKAIIAGQVAEESVRAQLIAAARLAYSPRFLVISDHVLVRGSCAPADNILNTLKSMPPPPEAGSPGLFAIASPGSTWSLIPVTQALVEAGGIAKSGLLPSGIPADVVENLTADAIEQLRLHLAPPVSR